MTDTLPAEGRIMPKRKANLRTEDGVESKDEGMVSQVATTPEGLPADTHVAQPTGEEGR